MNDRIGELLVQKNLLSEEQLRSARRKKRARAARASATRSRSSASSKKQQVADVVSNQYGVPDDQARRVRGRRRGHRADPGGSRAEAHDPAGEPRRLDADRRDVDPSNIFAIDDLKFLTGYNIEVVVASEEAIRRAIERYYDKGADLDEVMGDFDDDDIRARRRRGRRRRRRPREGGPRTRRSSSCAT